MKLITRVQWDSPEGEMVRAIRADVFIREQQLPPHEEYDAIDLTACHALLTLDGHPAATGRLFPFEDGGRIGRMAVLGKHRGLGLGRLIVDALLLEGRLRGWQRHVLDAQCHAIGFYERCGFRVIGPEHLDCGIPHRLMQKP